MKTKMIHKVLGVAVICITASLASVTEGNLISNGGFEADPDGTTVAGTDFIDTTTITDWRAFAVGGATAAFTVEAAAAHSGLVGMQIARDPGGADSALDRDADKVAIPAQQRIYKQLIDVRDGGANGGSTHFVYTTQFFDGGAFLGNQRGFGIDPQADWETTGSTARSNATEDQLAVRYSVEPSQSAYLDNVEVVDATSGVNRMINGGFENSSTRVLDYRFFAVGGHTGSVSLSGDAASGNNAALLERTAAPAGGDSGLDVDPFRIATLGGETLLVSLASKKVTGPADARVRVSVSMFNAAGGFIGDLPANLYDPGTSAYENFAAEFTLLADAAFVNVGVRIVNAAGAPGVGSYLIDNLSVKGIPEPASLALLGLGIVGLLSLRRREV